MRKSFSHNQVLLCAWSVRNKDEVHMTSETVQQIYEYLQGLFEDFLHSSGKHSLKLWALQILNINSKTQNDFYALGLGEMGNKILRTKTSGANPPAALEHAKRKMRSARTYIYMPLYHKGSTIERKVLNTLNTPRGASSHLSFATHTQLRPLTNLHLNPIHLRN